MAMRYYKDYCIDDKGGALIKKLLLLIVLFTLFFASEAWAQTTVEGESMTLPSGGSVVSDSSASGGKAALLTSNGTAKANYRGSVSTISFTLRGSQCGGAPRAVLYLDNVRIGSVDVTNTSTYSTWTISKTAADGAHTIGVQFENDYRTWSCDRNLYIDKILVKGTASSSGTGSLLTWAPPTLTNPTTVYVPARDTRYPNGVTELHLDSTKDYRIKLPSSKKVGGLQIYGGRNIVIIGGHISANPNRTTSNSDLAPLSIYVEKRSSGVIHIEGVLIDDSVGGQSDGININAPYATAQIENVRALLSGRDDRVHSDVISGYWDVGTMRIDRMTGLTNSTGLYFNGRGPLDVRNVDIGYRPSPWISDNSDHIMMWLNDNVVNGRTTNACDSDGATLSEVYVRPKSGHTLAGSVVPTSGWPNGCENDGGRSYVQFPKLTQVRGGAKLGPPPNGNFVPSGVAGVGYVSPGYR
jgi:hypothetical protein